MHEYFELSIPQVCALPLEHFLRRCELYLAITLRESAKHEVEWQGREYGREYLGIMPTPEEDMRFHLGL